MKYAVAFLCDQCETVNNYNKIRAANQVIMIYRIFNKSLCFHVCNVYIYYVYINTNT